MDLFCHLSFDLEFCVYRLSPYRGPLYREGQGTGQGTLDTGQKYVLPKACPKARIPLYKGNPSLTSFQEVLCLYLGYPYGEHQEAAGSSKEPHHTSYESSASLYNGAL